MKKNYFAFSRLRYQQDKGIETGVTVERIEKILGCTFQEIEVSRGLAEKAYEATVLGIKMHLEHWSYEDHLIVTLSGHTISYTDWDWEDVISLNDYFFNLFETQGMPGWYLPSKEECRRDSDLSGGEHMS